MRHEDIHPLLNAYLDNELGADEARSVEAHVATCGICTEELSQWRAVGLAVKSSNLSQLPVNEDFIARMHQQVDILARRGLERFAWGLSAVAAGLAIMGTVQLMRPTSAAPVAVAPAAWEGAAVALNGNSADDTTPTATSGDLAMTEWMVADLSEGSRPR